MYFFICGYDFASCFTESSVSFSCIFCALLCSSHNFLFCFVLTFSISSSQLSGSHSSCALDRVQNNATSSIALARVEKAFCATVPIGGSTEVWSHFHIRWRDYITATKVTVKDCVIQFCECCDENAWKDLTRAAGVILKTKTEEEVLAAINILAVIEKNVMFTRVTLYEMQQDEDKAIRSFCVRVRGKGGVCKYLLNYDCGRKISFIEHILLNVFVLDLAESEIQLDVWSDTNQNMTLKEVF